MALFLDLDVGESVRVGDVTVVVERKHGQRVRLAISAPRDTNIDMIRAAQERSAALSAHERRTFTEPAHGKHPL